MPLQIPATSFLMFAHLMGTGVPLPSDAWQLSSGDTDEAEQVVSATRRVASAQACLDFARAEAQRMALTDAREQTGGPVTFLQYAEGVSFSCTQIAPAAGLMAVYGPEALLRAQGYDFNSQR